MPSTRSQTGAKSHTASSTKSNGKRAAVDSGPSPAAKRGKLAKEKKDIGNKEQKTIEETMGHADDANGGDNRKVEDTHNEQKGNNGDDKSTDEEDISEDKTVSNGLKQGEKNAFDEVKGDVGEVKIDAKEEDKEKTEAIHENEDSVLKDSEREAAMPSSILEKGIIYFFFRGRVGVENPQGVDDVARSYIVLRPLPIGAKLGAGPLEDSGNARLLVLPKKVLPRSSKDRFLTFVEKGKASVNDLKEDFIKGNTYPTKTTGTSHVPAVTPIAEGIYALTTTGRESHLAYFITVPEIGEVQKSMGLNKKGSFVISTKNPETPAPGNAGLDNPAKYPAEVMEKFRGLRWLPTLPEHLGYEATQMLMIGEGQGDVEKATKKLERDDRDGKKEAPEEEMELLGEEDERRVRGLGENDAIWDDLGVSSKSYPDMQTTW